MIKFVLRGVKFSHISSAFRQIEHTASRNEKTAVFKRMMLEMSQQEMIDYVKVTLGLFRPRTDQSFDLSIAESITLQSLERCFQIKDNRQLKRMVTKMGDFGDVAVDLRAQYDVKHGPGLNMDTIVEAMNQINSMQGEDSVDRKVDFIASMFKMASSDDELRYLVRSFANTGLRIGLSTKTVESTVHEKFEYDEQALSLFEREIFGYRLRNLTNLPSKAMYHVPIKPMTGKPAKDAADLLKSLSKKVDRAKLVADYKYDGERTQIHWDQKKLSMFSRSCDDQKAKFWSLYNQIEQLCRQNNLGSFIADGEVVYVDREDGSILPFQEIERKEEEEIQKLQESGEYEFDGVPQVYLFDVLAKDEMSVCHLPLQERRLFINEIVDGEVIKMCHWVETQSIDADVETAIKKISKLAKEAGMEGLVVKGLETAYETSGTRTGMWMKLKNTALTSGMRDTLDLVPIGAYYGKGNRTGLYGSFLMASYNSSTKMFESICKLGTGFSREQLSHVQLEELSNDPDHQESIAKSLYRTSPLQKPDVWLKPTQIWEVQADSFTLSKSHRCGFDQIMSQTGYFGLSLRFPRFIRVRNDKRIRLRVKDYFELTTGESTSELGTQVSEILEMYNS